MEAADSNHQCDYEAQRLRNIPVSYVVSGRFCGWLASMESTTSKWSDRPSCGFVGPGQELDLLALFEGEAVRQIWFARGHLAVTAEHQRSAGTFRLLDDVAYWHFLDMARRPN
jgi:hypothetical protein